MASLQHSWFGFGLGLIVEDVSPDMKCRWHEAVLSRVEVLQTEAASAQVKLSIASCNHVKWKGTQPLRGEPNWSRLAGCNDVWERERSKGKHWEIYCRAPR